MGRQKKDNPTPRPPIVVVMGHIDHGKTTLLDYIRKTKVTEQEAGGITQHVSAYEIEIPSGKIGQARKITFIDTPGHEAFSKIRKRGAKIADVAILVIAADDKVNTQTIESLEAIKDDGLPFVVAINKTDKENADPERIKKELTEKGTYVEKWGGKIPCVEISAKTGAGIDELLEMILLMSDVEELSTKGKSGPDGKTEPASGFVLESYTDKKRGIAATLIIQNGVLERGMCVAVKDAVSPVRIFENFAGHSLKKAEVSSPVKIVGFNKIPEVGEKFESFLSKKDIQHQTTSDIVCTPTTPEIVEKNGENKTTIPVVIKADTISSAEALEKQIKKLEDDKISFNILRAGIGDTNENDIKLASSGDETIIIGFNVNCPHGIRLLAERFGAEVKLFNIIYEAEEWLREEIKKREPVETKEEIIGKAKILKIFRTEKSKKIIGGEVVSGKIAFNKYARILRRDFLLGEGRISELQRQKEKAEEIGEGEQFGALIQTKVDISPQDTLEIIEKTIT